MSVQRITPPGHAADPPPETPDELYDAAPVGYLTMRPDGAITRANGTLLGWIGYSLSDLIGKNLPDVLTAGARIFYETHCAPILRAEGTLKQIALDLAGAQGRVPALCDWRPITGQDGVLLGYRVLVVDATERRAYERDLLAERERARQTAAALSEREAALRRSNAEAKASAERMQLALSAGAILGTWDWDLVSGRFTLDERLASVFGLDSALGGMDLSVEQILPSIHQDDLGALRAAVVEVMARGGAFSHEYRVRGGSGPFRWVQATGRVEKAPEGTPARFPGVLLDVEGRRALEAERDSAATLLRAFVAAVPGVIYAKDRSGRLIVANEGTASLVGKPLNALLGRTDADFLDDPVEAKAIMATDRRIMESGATEQMEERVSLPDGTPAVWLSTKAPFRNDAGEIVGMIGTSVDITARKRAEDRLRLVVNELNHRVKNMLATVQSIAWQTVRNADPALRGALEARLMALAAAHDVLTREGWAGAEIAETVAGVIAPHGGAESGRFQVGGPPLRLAPRAAVALSMALHELATNALKYGALSTPGGSVHVQWDVIAEQGPSAELLALGRSAESAGAGNGASQGPNSASGAAKRTAALGERLTSHSGPDQSHGFRLCWSERGGPHVEQPDRRGFGTRLVERSLAQDLGGTARIAFHPDGVECIVEAPLVSLSAHAEDAPLPRVGGTGAD